jgi:pyruvate/2-oxoglutarate dehydrogenase complex dihydrolipoamide dehydrogenase (E3) component
MTTQNYDAVIVGSGQAAKPLAVALAQAGQQVALIEREHIGGTCVNEGCTPTKTMVASARVAYVAQRAANYGVHTGPISIDLARVRERKRAIVNDFRGGGERTLARAGVTVLMGEARFRNQTTLDVQLNSGEQLAVTAKQIFINTGTRTALPKLPGIANLPVLTSTSIMELDQVPEHLLILGGGYIGVEFGQMFRRFGSQVTIVQRGAQLLAREDEDVATEVATLLRDDGLTVLLNAEALQVAQTGNSTIQLTIQTPAGQQTLHGSHLLAAAGRTPNTDRLNLAAAEIVTDSHGFIVVNERLETNVPGVYALGDVKGGPAFTHISYDDYRIVRTNLLEGGNATTTGRMVPYTVFIDPQLGRVGLSEQEARASGRAIRVAKIPMTYVARALEMDETRGLMKAIVAADTDQILGFACLGIEGGEVMSMVQLAMLGQLPYTVLRDAVFSHPNLSEALNTLFTQFEE